LLLESAKHVPEGCGCLLRDYAVAERFKLVTSREL